MKVDLTKLVDDPDFQISDISCLNEQNLTCISSFKGYILGYFLFFLR